jgi:hypothetical protein
MIICRRVVPAGWGLFLHCAVSRIRVRRGPGTCVVVHRSYVCLACGMSPHMGRQGVSWCWHPTGRCDEDRGGTSNNPSRLITARFHAVASGEDGTPRAAGSARTGSIRGRYHHCRREQDECQADHNFAGVHVRFLNHCRWVGDTPNRTRVSPDYTVKQSC